jgi:hypothetical protein
VSESIDAHECPADGCDYVGNLRSVCGHYGGTKDADHAGHYHEAREILVGDDGGDGTDAPSGDGPDPSDRDGNPTFGAADPTRDPDPDVDDDPNGLELPCGHEVVAHDDLPELPCNVTCETCGQTWGLRA